MNPSPTPSLYFVVVVAVVVVVLLLSFEILLSLLMQPQNNFLGAPALKTFSSPVTPSPIYLAQDKVSCSAQAGSATDLQQYSPMQFQIRIKPVCKLSLNSFCKYPFMQQDRSKCIIIHWAQKNQCQ